MALQADETIVAGRYHVVRQIGEGGQARVWLAEDRMRSLQVAIKEPAPDLTGSQIADQADRYRRELRYSGALFQSEVPNTVRVITVEEWDGIPLLVMEYCGGGSLQDRLAHTGALPVAEAVQISLDLLGALSVVHEKLGWVHRDIKPANVLFTADGHTRLADFGLAQTMESGRSMSSQPHPGTPAYMSPEQESTRGYLSPATDLYTVGCLLFEMLSGTLYKRVRPGTAVSNLRPDIPAWLDAVLAKALQDDIWNRYESATAMAAALRQLPPAGQPAAGVVAAGASPAARGAEGGLAQPLAAGRAFSAYPAGRRGMPSAHPRALVSVAIVVAAAALLLAVAVSQMQERQRHAAATATAETRWTAMMQAQATADALRTATMVAAATATAVARRTATQEAAAAATVAVGPLPSAATPATVNTPRPTNTPQPMPEPPPTWTPVPAPTWTPAPPPPVVLATAEQAIRDYYSLIQNADYATAWSMSRDWTIARFGVSFNGWINDWKTSGPAVIQGALSVTGNDANTTVVVTLRYAKIGKTYKFSYGLRRDFQSGAERFGYWVFVSSKVL